MDVVVTFGDQLVIEIDVFGTDDEPYDLDGADVRYVIQDVVNVTETDDEVDLVTIDGVVSQIRLTVPVNFGPGRFVHECKFTKSDVGPVTVLPRSTIFVRNSLIGNEV